MRCETFPELGGDCLEVKGRGHMAPDIAFFHQLFVSLQCWCIQRGGHRKSKGHFPGFLLFCSSSLSFFCYFFFNFLTVNFVKQAIQLHICFLLVLPHDVNSFHSYHVCGELITLIDSCEEGMSGCITVFSRAFLCVCVFVFFGAVGAGQDGGLLRSKQRERVSSAKFYLTQRKQNNHTSRTAQQHLSLPPLPPTPHDLQPTKTNHPIPSPFTRLSSSLTHWTCPCSCMHLRRLASNSPSATATLCASASYSTYITIILIMTWVCDREC